MTFREAGSLVWRTVDEFMHDECGRSAAAISYYALFSLPALAVVAALSLRRLLGPSATQDLITEAVAGWTSPAVAETVGRLVGGAEVPRIEDPLAYFLGLAGVVFGATGSFLQVQRALNRAWYVRPGAGGVRAFFWKRAVSFPVLLLLFALLIVGFGASAYLLSFGRARLETLWGPLGTWLPVALDLGVSVSLLWLIVAVVFWLLPDAEIAWRDVLLGSFVTAWLVWLGKILVAAWVSGPGPAQAFGPAASLALVLLWIYFTSMFLLLGAEFTQVWARRAGRPIRPSPGAEISPGGRERLERLEPRPGAEG